MSGFEALEFRYADPARLNQRARGFEFVRLLRFIRLWKKLGWSIEKTDKAITALYPGEHNPNTGTDEDLNRLDAGFRELLPRLGILGRVIERLNLTVRDSAADMAAKAKYVTVTFLTAAVVPNHAVHQHLP